ncbi:MAG: glycosyltransferase family 39 protein [Deltaproteobacteria bacterium]|nr:glycosyltransferase family 39 protein [Deltaproteobacteria bacterium]MBZ0219037.1 glycosyltransferase family 39 protein [Deltaproteobacteria bacterium]
MSGSGENRAYLAWFVVITAAVIGALIRSHLLDVPLERDEGEYAYAAQLLLKGIPPYEFMHSLKLPGVFTAYALIMLAFGQTAAGIHLGLLAVNFLSVVLMYLLSRKFLPPVPSALSASFFAVLSLSSSFLGLSANTEHFVVFFVIGGLLFLFRSVESRKTLLFFLCGLFFGFAFLMKQHAIIFTALPVSYVAILQLRERVYIRGELLRFSAMFFLGAALPFGLTALIFWVWGVFDKFFFWTFLYASKYVSRVDFPTGLQILKSAIYQMKGSVLPLIAVSCAGLLFPPARRDSRNRFIFLWLFFIISALAVSPGFYFREHYFILLLPVLSMLFGVVVSRIMDGMEKLRIMMADWVLICASFLFLAYPLFKDRTILFFSTPDEVSRTLYGANPFPESAEIARYIRNNSGPDDTIIVLGSEPQIYFLSDRRSATPYIYMYPIVEPHEYAKHMDVELRADIAQNRPSFLVYANIHRSWGISRGKMHVVTDWFSQLELGDYELDGIVHIKPAGTEYKWGPQTEFDYNALNPYNNWLLVLKRTS